jgi:parallel beta-helix repeat protein
MLTETVLRIAAAHRWLACFASAFLLAAAHPALAGTIVVGPGGSIRAALSRASPGDRIEVLPGTYHEGAPGDLNALTVTKDGIALVGRSSPGRPVVLENAGGQSYGVWVSPADSAGPGPQADDEHPPCGIAGTALHGFSISGFTVRGFAEHGVHLACVDGFSIVGNEAQDSGVYGLFPVVSRNGLVARNVVTGTVTDAGIYVGQSDRVLVASNVATGNELGIEIENSRNCAAVGNQVSGNTMGLFVDILPFLERTTQEATLVAGNSVRDNNRPNTADPADLLGVLPPGLGILVAGGRATTVAGNEVTGNGFAGIAVVSLCLGLALQGAGCDGLDIDPNPVGDRVVGNRVLGNGTAALPPPFDGLEADLVWDGSGADDCWSGNRFATSVPQPLPACR